MNEYEVKIGGATCRTPPLRDEEEAQAYAVKWYAGLTRIGKINGIYNVPRCTSIQMLRRGVVPHDLSSGTSEA